MRKSLLIATFVALLAVVATSSCLAEESATPARVERSDTARIIDYLFALFRIQARLDAMAKTKTADDPELQELTLQMLEGLDTKVLSDQFSKLVTIPKSSVAYCLAFPSSAAGKAALGVAARVNDDTELMAGLQALPPSQSNAVAGYLSSPCTIAVTSAMTSDEGKALFLGFSEFVGCKFVREKRPDKLELMQSHGKCL